MFGPPRPKTASSKGGGRSSRASISSNSSSSSSSSTATTTTKKSTRKPAVPIFSARRVKLPASVTGGGDGGGGDGDGDQPRRRRNMHAKKASLHEWVHAKIKPIAVTPEVKKKKHRKQKIKSTPATTTTTATATTTTATTTPSPPASAAAAVADGTAPTATPTNEQHNDDDKSSNYSSSSSSSASSSPATTPRKTAATAASPSAAPPGEVILDHKDIMEAFAIMEAEDDNGTPLGYIEVDELRTLLPTISARFMDETIMDRFVSHADPRGTGRLKFNSFVRSMKAFMFEAHQQVRQRNTDSTLTREEMKTASIDTLEILHVMDPSDTGFVNSSELLELLPSINESIPEDDVERMFAEADPKGTGKIARLPFLRMMKKMTSHEPTPVDSVAKVNEAPGNDTSFFARRRLVRKLSSSNNISGD